jgi:hypothetical protein
MAIEGGAVDVNVCVTTCATVHGVRNTRLGAKGCITHNGLKHDILLSQFPRGLASNRVARMWLRCVSCSCRHNTTVHIGPVLTDTADTSFESLLQDTAQMFTC